MVEVCLASDAVGLASDFLDVLDFSDFSEFSEFSELVGAAACFLARELRRRCLFRPGLSLASTSERAEDFQFSASTAVGLFKSVISTTLIVSSYKIADWTTGYKII